jgi:hypothetical protein
MFRARVKPTARERKIAERMYFVLNWGDAIQANYSLLI